MSIHQSCSAMGLVVGVVVAVVMCDLLPSDGFWLLCSSLSLRHRYTVEGMRLEQTMWRSTAVLFGVGVARGKLYGCLLIGDAIPLSWKTWKGQLSACNMIILQTQNCGFFNCCCWQYIDIDIVWAVTCSRSKQKHAGNGWRGQASYVNMDELVVTSLNTEVNQLLSSDQAC